MKTIRKFLKYDLLNQVFLYYKILRIEKNDAVCVFVCPVGGGWRVSQLTQYLQVRQLARPRRAAARRRRENMPDSNILEIAVKI